MTEECLGQAQTVAQGSEADIQSLSDDLNGYARHNFSNTVVVNMQVTKESAKKFKENRQVQKSDRINSDRQSGSDQLGSPPIVSNHEKNIKLNEMLKLVPI